METTHPCPFPKCDGQMHQLTGQYQYGRWFCDACWFTLPRDFFSQNESNRHLFLEERVIKYRQLLVEERLKKVKSALAALRKVTPVDDEPDIARALELVKLLRSPHG